MDFPFAFSGFRLLLLVLAAVQVSCGQGGDEKTIEVRDRAATSEAEVDGWDAIVSQKKGGVLLFTAPECPLCLNYAPAFAEFAESMKETELEVVSVVSGTYYSRRESERFLTDHGIDMVLIVDTDYVLSRKYNATITPEAVLVDSLGNAIYRGAFDNWAISLGRKRLEPTEHYLRDAIDNYLAGRDIDPKTTDAVGCFIE